MSEQSEIIVITDGDKIACRAVEEAGRQLNLRTISASQGNPTPLTGRELLKLIKQAPHCPVLVMVDDCGNPHQGKGEEVLRYLGTHPEIEIIGVVAVAANIHHVQGIAVDFSISATCQIVPGPVDKNGRFEGLSNRFVEGDTVDILNQLNIPLIVGIGDLGKMDGRDSTDNGACITTRAIQEILTRSGFDAKTPNR